MKLTNYFLIFVFVLGGFFIFGKISSAATADHLVISEVQVAGATAYDEFIELYNPTLNTINIGNWSIQYKSATGSTWSKKNFTAAANIPAHGWYLIVYKDYTGSTTPDMSHSTFSLAANGGNVFLVNNQTTLTSATDQSIVDKIGYGTGNSPEGIAVSFPEANQSIERKLGGDLGNSEDTNDNSVDFILQTTPNLQNTSSSPKPTLTSPPPDDQNPPAENPATEETPPAETSETIITSSYTPEFGDIVINEFVADPADGDEWIEIYNKTSQEIDLTGWIIEEGSESTTDIAGVIGREGAEKFFIIEKPKGNLNNAGDIIFLKDKNGYIIDQAIYGNWNDGNLEDNAPKASDPYSVARITDGQNTFNNANDFKITKILTKGAPNIISEEAAEELDQIQENYSSDIIINEILPNPKGSDNENEFIELKNISAREINLAGWKLGDSTTRKYIISQDDFPTTIVKPQDFFILKRKATGIALNNSGGDAVKLYWINNYLIETVEYKESAKEDQTYARDNDNKWTWTTTVTEGKENILTIPNEPPEAIIGVKEEGLTGEEIKFDGSDSTDSDGGALTYLWNFGDGETSSEPTPTHVFNKSGKYKIKLTVADKLAAIGEKTANLTIKTSNSSSAEITVAYNGKPGIIINEFIPNPAGADESEWIELKNIAAYEINLADWQIDDAKDGSRPYAIPEGTIIKPNELLIFHRQKTKLALNNNLDSVRLFNNNDELVYQIDYEDAKEGLAYALDQNNNWQWTSTPTPGTENLIVEEAKTTAVKTTAAKTKKTAQIIETTLMKVREQDIGDKVRVQGLVAAEPGLLGKTIFYLAGSGIQIYFSKSDWPKLTLGDSVEITGTLSESGGESRIKLADKTDIKLLTHESPPLPKEITDEEIGEDLEGYLIKIQGEVLQTKGQTIYLDNGGQELPIYIKTTTAIGKPKFEEGAQLAVTGIVSQTKSGYRILPRYPGDLEIVAPPNSEQQISSLGANNTKSDIIKYLTVTASGLMLILVGLVARNKERVKKYLRREKT
jgi:PKD repeat protein